MASCVISSSFSLHTVRTKQPKAN